MATRATLVGGWAFARLIMLGLPGLHQVATADGDHFVSATLSSRTFALAVLAGATS